MLLYFKKSIHHLFRNPKLFLRILWDRTAPIWSDAFYLKVKFWLRLNYWPNFKNPQTYNEKLQWLKLYYKNPDYEKMVDKISAKDYVAQIIGPQYIIPTLGIWDDVESIDWDCLPNQFVIKCSSDSGGIVVCKDKKILDLKVAKAKLLKGWGRNYYRYNKEYPYKNLKPRIIAEEYMEDESGFELKDYKIFCFDGVPKFLFVASDRQAKGEETKFDFFDLEWNHIPVTNGHPNSTKKIEKPQNFSEMLQVASKLSQGMSHVRVDLYNVNGKIYFGELTFFHWSGMTPFYPQKWDYIFGDYIKLPSKNCL